MTGTRETYSRYATDRSEHNNTSDGSGEPISRRTDATLGNEAYLNRIWALIDREAARASVSTEYATTCLANGVDPLRFRKAGIVVTKFERLRFIPHSGKAS